MAVSVFNAYYLAGSWLNAMLYALELVLICRYLMGPSRSRPRAHKLGMLALVIFDTACTIGIFAHVYVTVLVSPFVPPLDPGFPEGPLNTFLNSLAVILFATYASASAEQLFLTYIFFALTKQKLITAFLIVCVFVHLAFSYASAGLVLTTHSPFGAALLTTDVGAITCAATDILIASVLLFTFIRLDTRTAVRQSTHSLLRRLMLLIATSGTIVASNTLITVILLMKLHPAEPLFFSLQGRIYSLTILANFLVGNPTPGAPTTATATGQQGRGRGRGGSLSATAGGTTTTTTSGVVFRVAYNTTTEWRDDNGQPLTLESDDVDTLPSKTQPPSLSLSLGDIADDMPSYEFDLEYQAPRWGSK
ncbi:hypothetical protein C8F01DRAFT_1232486 [Mycena amicta]|nr:hypothetical protein C8F01DRAFT_1232486 [Mycena amicta]